MTRQNLGHYHDRVADFERHRSDCRTTGDERVHEGHSILESYDFDQVLRQEVLSSLLTSEDLVTTDPRSWVHEVTVGALSQQVWATDDLDALVGVHPDWHALVETEPGARLLSEPEPEDGSPRALTLLAWECWTRLDAWRPESPQELEDLLRGALETVTSLRHLLVLSLCDDFDEFRQQYGPEAQAVRAAVRCTETEVTRAST